MSDFDEFRARFRVKDLTIKEFRHWTWSVRPVQSTLGASILSLNVPASQWSQASSAAMAELHEVITNIENGLKKTFGYDRINYFMLMMVDFHVHFHVLPRYQSARSFAGREWVDRSWPKPPEVGGEAAPDMILATIRSALVND